jgi:hypothetical protein
VQRLLSIYLSFCATLIYLFVLHQHVVLQLHPSRPCVLTQLLQLPESVSPSNQNLPICCHLTSLSRIDTDLAASSNSSTALAVSTDGSCGDGTSFICLGSRWGDCCSSKGWCGKDGAYCGAGCQIKFGNCTAAAASSSPGGSSTTSISTDGSCGGSTGSICLGSTFGDCCSEKGYCGGNSSYCAIGCQSDFGHCGSTNQTAQISTDGSCGGSSGSTCLGSIFGDCCSAKNYCGGNSSYCDAGCQNGFGKCSASPSTSSSSSSTSSTSTSTSTNTAAAAATTTNLPIPVVKTTGFKAGIAVASIIAFLALLALALFLLFQRRKNNAPPKTISDYAVEAPSDSASSAPLATDNDKAYPSELSTVGYYQEMPADEKNTTSARVDERANAGYDGAYRGH